MIAATMMIRMLTRMARTRTILIILMATTSLIIIKTHFKIKKIMVATINIKILTRNVIPVMTHKAMEIMILIILVIVLLIIKRLTITL